MGVHVSIASRDDKISLPLKMKVSVASQEASDCLSFSRALCGLQSFFRTLLHLSEISHLQI